MRSVGSVKIGEEFGFKMFSIDESLVDFVEHVFGEHIKCFVDILAI